MEAIEVVVVGNGISRTTNNWQEVVKPYLRSDVKLWVCNWAFQESFFKPIDRVGTVHPEVIRMAYARKRSTRAKYEIWSKAELRRPSIDKYFSLRKGWSTGNMLVAQALHEGYRHILLVGFDFGGKDIYQPNLLYGANFKEQFNTIQQMWPDASLYFVEDIKELLGKEGSDES